MNRDEILNSGMVLISTLKKNLRFIFSSSVKEYKGLLYFLRNYRRDDNTVIDLDAGLKSQEIRRKM